MFILCFQNMRVGAGAIIGVNIRGPGGSRDSRMRRPFRFSDCDLVGQGSRSTQAQERGQMNRLPMCPLRKCEDEG